ENDFFGSWSAEVLHGVVASRGTALSDADAKFEDVRIEQILPVRRRLLPPIHELVGKTLGGEAARAVQVSDIFQHDAVIVAVPLDPLPGLFAVGGVAVLIGA